MFPEANYYLITPEGKLNCLLCPQDCRIAPGNAGFCKVRRFEGQKLVAANYGIISSIAVDPIEKKPLYHYYPGKTILSVGTVGCNLACEFCQNWRISREGAGILDGSQIVSPVELAEIAVKARHETESIGIAYTYSEPGVWFEYLKATMPLIKDRGLKNVLVTNAHLNPEPWRELLKWTDAANIDLKGFREDYYRKLCHGKLAPVLANIAASVGIIHLELTTLIIPGENDQPEVIREQAKWIASLDPEIPLHFSRYYPNYKVSKPATPIETLQTAYEIAREYLKYVYVGNAGRTNDTRCPDCEALLIVRNGYHTTLIAVETCPECGREIKIEH